MLDKEERALLVVPYSPPPAPRHHLIGGAAALVVGALALLGLFMADYSTTTTVWLTVITVSGIASAFGLGVAGITARRRFRVEMERATPVPVEPVSETGSAEAV